MECNRFFSSAVVKVLVLLVLTVAPVFPHLRPTRLRGAAAILASKDSIRSLRQLTGRFH